jgi:hypothetical protein
MNRLIHLAVLLTVTGCGSFAPKQFEERRNVFIQLHSPVTATMGNGRPCFVVPAGRLRQTGRTATEGVYEHSVTTKNTCPKGGTGRPGLTIGIRRGENADRRVVAFHTSFPAERYRINEAPELTLFRGSKELLRINFEPTTTDSAPFEFRGDALGQSGDRTRERHPNAACREVGTEALACTERGSTFAGEPASSIIYGIYQNRLVAIAVTLGAEADRKLIMEALVAKHGAHIVRRGPPHSAVWRSLISEIEFETGVDGLLRVTYSEIAGISDYQAARRQRASDDL